MFPKIKRCPCCTTINLIKINGVVYDNQFKSIEDLILKKIFNCRKCKQQLDLYINQSERKEKLIWLAHYKCYDDYFNELSRLEKEKHKSKKASKNYFVILKEIRKVHNVISLNQTKAKIKLKIENRSMQFGHA